MSRKRSNPHDFGSFPGRADTGRRTVGQIPAVGELICWIASREPLRVFRVDDVHQANWATETHTAWVQAGRPAWETWEGRERAVGVEPPGGGKRTGRPLHPWWHGEQWAPLSDPYPACVRCGLLWPCPCDDDNREAAASMAEMARLAGIMPGCCWACNEPILDRNKSVVFEGENLLYPGAGPAVFHTAYSRKAKGRRSSGTCRRDAEKYEDRWVAAAPGRRWLLRCPGHQFRHYHGIVECTESDGCTGQDARHAGWDHCTTQVFPNGSAFYVPGAPYRDGEIRPATRCGGRGCRGVAEPAQVAETQT